jgi:hypothetical protein
MTACSWEGSARADTAAWEPCTEGVARHPFPELTSGELAPLHALAKTKLPNDDPRSYVYVQTPAYFHGGCAYVTCGSGVEAVLFVLP